MPSLAFEEPVPEDFRLLAVVHSHGWYQLPPFAWDGTALSTVAAVAGRPTTLEIRQPAAGEPLQVAATWKGRAAREAALRTLVRRKLSLDWDLADFYATGGDGYAWAKRLGAGRYLRGATVFEDAVKLLATTNCSWSLTRLMVGRLVAELGEATPDGRRTFPTPAAMAAKPVEWYRETVRAGYRAPYFHALATRVANGTLDTEAWERHPGTTAELTKAVRAEAGFGPYAAECVCKLLGRFDGLGIDSWCIAEFPKVHGPVRGDVRKAIERHYKPLGRWQGLGLWLDLTRSWYESGSFGGGKFPD